MTANPDSTSASSNRRRTVFLFPGQGAQQPRMAADLYGINETFTTVMDQAFDILDDPALRKVWLQHNPGPLFHDITRAQPLLLSVNCALASTLIEAGVHPDGLLGHSVGEISAAVVAGVLDFGDALALIASFVRQYQHAPAGGMLAVAGSEEEIEERIAGIDHVSVGVVNGPRQVLVCGSTSGLREVRRRLMRDGVTCADVNALQPFHSDLMNDILETVERPQWDTEMHNFVRRPGCQLYSGYLGSRVPDDHTFDPNYWLEQPARQVRFGPALRAALADGPCTLIECGPGRSLTALARRLPPVASGESTCIAVIPGRRSDDDNDTLDAALARLCGHEGVIQTERTGR
ncbi:acyltransferase domain-containing protein [Tsukamurella pulmonis]|uniref:acyltransferase domain-containing protein n=1 Tax=Tsukamurella pulmonis TaxID=47312 RepID=UPI0022B23F1A|nr:acyltransferase domain-containing protein [Tsukamurella pulmonis]